MSHWIDRRRSGVLLHISALPGPFQQGVLGQEARDFVDIIADSGFSVWQFLPLGPTHGHGSPYESLSSAAGNPDFIDLRYCVDRGWISEAACQAASDGSITPKAARSEAANGFWEHVAEDAELSGTVDSFLTQNGDWLDDFVLFTALKNDFDDMPWWQWPKPLRDRSAHALDQASASHTACIRQVQFEQFMFSFQWRQLKEYAEQRGVLLFGDIPIYVSHDSADVWSARQLFTINDEGMCDHVAGVPPDYFSESGQRWGNPLYHWETMEADGFDWWIQRIRRQLDRMHLMRIDHFRGIESYWSIPGEMQDGRTGEWLPAPGEKLLTAMQQEFGNLPLIAEDLGLITPEVTALREKFGLPGMKILHFAFGDNASNPYLPHNHEYDCVAYTGTHDNDTTAGWISQIGEQEKKRAIDYLGIDGDTEILDGMIRAALASVARLSILPVQDIVGLGTEARFNKPGTLDGNWCWRLDSLEDLRDQQKRFASLNATYGR